MIEDLVIMDELTMAGGDGVFTAVVAVDNGVVGSSKPFAVCLGGVIGPEAVVAVEDGVMGSLTPLAVCLVGVVGVGGVESMA